MGGGDGGEALVGDAEPSAEGRGRGVEQRTFKVAEIGVEPVQADQIGEDKTSLDRLNEGADSGDGVDELLGGPRHSRGALLKDGEAGAEADRFAKRHAGANAASSRLGSDFEDSEPTLVGECNRLAGQVRAAHQFRGESERRDQEASNHHVAPPPRGTGHHTELMFCM